MKLARHLDFKSTGAAARAAVLLAFLVLAIKATADDFFVSTVADISAATARAKPGDTLTMRSGFWPDADILFSGNGTAESNITLRAQAPGQVVLSGGSRLRISGNYLVVDGLKFMNGYLVGVDVISFRNTGSSPADNCRLTNCAIIDYNPDDPTLENIWVSLYGLSNRVENCYFKGKDNVGTTLVVCLENQPDYHAYA